VAAFKAEVETISHERDAARSEVESAKRQILTEKEAALKAKDEELQKVKEDAESVATEIGTVKENLNAAIAKVSSYIYMVVYELNSNMSYCHSQPNRLRKLKTRRLESKG
jgi:uncharacterized protein (DUF3084 family)